MLRVQGELGRREALRRVAVREVLPRRLLAEVPARRVREPGLPLPSAQLRQLPRLEPLQPAALERYRRACARARGGGGGGTRDGRQRALTPAEFAGVTSLAGHRPGQDFDGPSGLCSFPLRHLDDPESGRGDPRTVVIGSACSPCSGFAHAAGVVRSQRNQRWARGRRGAAGGGFAPPSAARCPPPPPGGLALGGTWLRWGDLGAPTGIGRAEAGAHSAPYRAQEAPPPFRERARPAVARGASQGVLGAASSLSPVNPARARPQRASLRR